MTSWKQVERLAKKHGLTLEQKFRTGRSYDKYTLYEGNELMGEFPTLDAVYAFMVSWYGYTLPKKEHEKIGRRYERSRL
jgi:hypothetical protein